jgi:hypothetical protein
MIRKLAYGMLAGVAATTAMSALMLAANRAGVMGKTPPAKITERFLDKIGKPQPKTTTRALAAGAHLGYGAVFGALFAGLSDRFYLSRPITSGVVFGSLLWGASYFGWVPAMGVLPPPTRDRPGRPLTMFASHLVYGAVLGALATKPRLRLSAPVPSP